MSRKRQEKRNQEKALEYPDKCRYHKFEPPKPRVPPTEAERKMAKQKLAALLGIMQAIDIPREYY